MGNCLVCSAAISDTEDFCDECFSDMEQERECQFCSRKLTDHSINCSENESPFSELVRNGFD
jgi:predicted nucleic acid-binding Zn ribbon protein